MVCQSGAKIYLHVSNILTIIYVPLVDTTHGRSTDRTSEKGMLSKIDQNRFAFPQSVNDLISSIAGKNVF